MFTIDIKDQLTPFNRALQAGLRAQSINPPIGVAVKKLFQDHFLSLPPNRMDWPTTNFWSRCAKATHYDLIGFGVLISVSQVGALQRLKGGDITPVNARNLAIPASPETYGKAPGEFDHLAIMWRWSDGSPKAIGLVAQRATATIIERAKSGKRAYKAVAEMVGQVVMFWLIKKVHQQGDPNTIPSEVEIRSVIDTTVQGVVDRATRRAGRG